MNNVFQLKACIFDEVRKHRLDLPTDDLELGNLIFYPGSLRLTYTGFLIIKKIFTAYSFPIPHNLKSKHRISLSRLAYPYFLTSKRLILFSEMDASMVKLSGGVDKFLEIYD